MRLYTYPVNLLCPVIEYYVPLLLKAKINPAHVIEIAVLSYHTHYFNHTLSASERMLQWLVDNESNIADVHGTGLVEQVLSPVVRQVYNTLHRDCGNIKVEHVRWVGARTLEIQY